MSKTVVASPPTTTERPGSRQTGDPAALAFRRRIQAIDRLARGLISFSGIAIIAAVLGIGLFLFLEILPLLSGAHVTPGRIQPALGARDAARLVVVDEHQEEAAVLGGEPVLRVFGLGGSVSSELILLSELAGQRVTAAGRVLEADTTVLGTDRGEVWIGRIGMRTHFDGAERKILPVVEHDALLAAAPGHRISQAAYRDAGAARLAVVIADGAHVVATRLTVTRPLIGPERKTLDSLPLPMDPAWGAPTQILVSEPANQVLVGTSAGLIVRWAVPSDGPAVQLETVPAVPSGAVTAMTYLLGSRSVAVGGSDGSVATWSLVRRESSPDGWHLLRIHPFDAHPAAVALISPSPRDKGFLTMSEDGTVRLHYMTSERTLASWPAGAAPVAAHFAPKTNGTVVMTADGQLRHWRIDNPHPEISWRALFGPVWYEGYERPDYIWQSTGGTDDFESKFSLVPLIYGTLKGTFYALLFAIPLALFGALYCSQFLEKRLRSPVKSTVELMAALPSVVLGFVAGVVIAPLFQQNITGALAAPLLVPLVAVCGVAACAGAPWPAMRTLVRRHEFPAVLVWVMAGLAASIWAGPWLERALFGGDFETWLMTTTGIRYDQRNSLVVGWAMGFAVIPIIFTICEDAFSAVPRPLVGASLACGASLWQTAWRVVLPAAGSGVFSAIMIGFGRAVGETMIVLMATGNTPVMDWSMFNGFRALSANIAVEIPEAPEGGTLYRVLFIAALLLFSMTFAVNTVAEVIRLRLRRQLQGL